MIRTAGDDTMHDLMKHHENKLTMRNLFITLLVLVLTTGLLFSCGGGTAGSTTPAPGQAAAAGDLVSWSWAVTLNTTTLNAAIIAAGMIGFTAVSDVSCYKLTYKTPHASGALINASGLVCLPATRSGGRPVLSYQHGTIFQDVDAPSSFSTSAEGLLGAVFAAIGYIVVMPDYIGYGDSTALLHPFVHAATLASATVDMNRAARVFFKQPGIGGVTNGQLFLAGYSEGGYATLATQRLMEQSLKTEFPITASEPGAGPYDLSSTTQTILGLATLPQPAFAGFFLVAYDSLYNQPSQLAYYFSSTYASVDATLFDGRFTRGQIASALGGSNVLTSTLFNPAFIASFLGTGETALKAHIAENNIYNWAHAVPTRLFQGQNDDIVPYANTTTAKAAMNSNGSTSVTVVNCNAGALPTTHENCIPPFAIDVVIYFNTLATGL
jgi:pimeloyl-ACP methyl ester carboxylesterase